MQTKQNHDTIIDLRPICINKVELQPNVLWKYQNTPLTKEPIQQIDHQNSEISYTIKEYTIQGKLINRDYKNIRKIQIKYDQKSYFGLHLALQQMGLKEIAVFEINPNLRKTLTQLQTELENKDIPIIQVVEKKYANIVDENIIWIIEIHDVLEKFSIQDLTPEERLKHYNILKPQATQLFKEQQYQKAIEMYKKMRPFLDQIKKEFKEKMTPEIKLLFKQELSRTFSNQAICYLLLNDYAKSCENADLAIKEWNDNFKAYFIRAKAYFERGQESEAMPMFQEIMVKFKDQDLSEVQKYLKQYQKQKIEKNEQKWCQKILQKFSEPDLEEEERRKREKLEQLDKNRQTQKIIESAKNGKIINHEDIQKLQ